MSNVSFKCDKCEKEFKNIFSLSAHKGHCGKENSTSHLDNHRAWSKGKTAVTDSAVSRMSKNKWTFETVFCEASNAKRGYVRSLLIRLQSRGNKCEICNIEEWNGSSITFELDHINGIRDDNRLENLRFLCPNCHSQTDTFRNKNCNKKRIREGKSLNFVYQRNKNGMDEVKIKEYFNKINSKEEDRIKEQKSLKKEKEVSYNRSKIGKGPTYQEIDDTQKIRVQYLRQADIDFSKWGWTVKVAELLSMPSQKVRRWMTKWTPDLLENSFKRK